VCGADDTLRIARAALHEWEEPAVSVGRGSGTVFFSGCPLRCVYCQNYELSHGADGKPVTPERLAEIFLELQEAGAHNINLVTPTQYIPQIVFAARRARDEGLTLPFVCNCSGYESAESLKRLEGIADIYLTDFKYMDPAAAKKYSAAEDYPERAKEALREMMRQQGEAVFAEDQPEALVLMKKGVIVRHLLLPGLVRSGKAVIQYVYETYGDALYLSLMRQYTPFGKAAQYPELNRKVTAREYDSLVDYAIGLGVTNCFIQEGAAAKESFIPEFS
jgi:putative pyruvate formate lyase activating enzyme